MHKISIDPPKTIVKKRQQCACDSCRKSKKRCDGESPCARCKRNNKPCLYSPQKKRTSANSISPTESTTSNNNDKLPVIPAVPVPTSTALVNPQISQQPYPREISEYPTFSETAMVDLLIKNKYIEAYFTIINPQCSFICPKETMLFIENPTKPSARLQLSCILATTSRTFGEYSLSTYFENRAKVIAKEVFDEFTPEAALGFALLSGCLWASDRTSTAHYRDITLSIIKRVRNKGKSSKKLLDRLLRIEMAVAAYPDNDKSETLAECRELAEKIRKFIATEDKEYDALVSSDSASQQMLPIPHFLTMLEFRAKFYEAVLENNPNANIYEKGFNPFRTLDKPTSEELFVLVRDCSKLISFIYRHTPHYPLIFSLLLSYEAILYYASGDPARAVATIRYVVHNLLIHVSLIRFLNPFVAGGLHFMFLICIYQKEFALARDVLNFLALVAAHLPVAQDLLEQNEDVFRSSQAEATDSGERLSNSFSPPQVSIEELPPDSLAMQYSVWSSNWNPPRIATSASNQFKPVSQPNPADHVPLSAVYANGGSFPEGFSPSLGSSQPSPSSSQPSPVANFSQSSPGSIYSPASPANGLHSYTQASPVVYSSSSPSSPGSSPYSPGSSPSLSSPSQPPSPNQGSRVPLFQQVLTQQLPTAPQHSVPAQQQVPAHVRSQFSPSSYSNNPGPGISLAHHGVHPDYKSQKIYAPLTPGMHDFPEFSTQMAGSVTSWHPSFCAPQSESPDFDPETGLEFSGFEFLNTL